MAFSNYLLGLGLVGIAGTFGGTALAQTCKTDTDCLVGFICKTETVNSISVAPCAKDTVCDATATTTTSTYSYCAPKPCASDSDCTNGMICHSTTAESCTGGTSDCKPGVTCPAPVPPECTKVTTSQCVYSWQLPCNSDSECGNGFRCQPTTYGMCSGSGGTATGGSVATGGASKPATGTGSATGTAVSVGTATAVDTVPTTNFAPKTVTTVATSTGTNSGTGTTTTAEMPVPPPDPTIPVPGSGGAIGIAPPTSTITRTDTTVCTTVTQYPGSCVPKATTCATDSDCPSVFVCQGSRNSTSTTPVTPTGGATSIGSADPMPTGATTAVTTNTGTTLIPVVVAKSCVSPISTYGTVSTTDKGGIAIPTTSNPRPEDQNGSTSTATSVTTGSTTIGIKSPPATGPSGTGGTTAETAKSSGGCQLGHSGDGALVGLSLLGFAALVSRRRRRV